MSPSLIYLTRSQEKTCQNYTCCVLFQPVYGDGQLIFNIRMPDWTGSPVDNCSEPLGKTRAVARFETLVAKLATKSGMVTEIDVQARYCALVWFDPTKGVTEDCLVLIRLE